jgi:3-hydroxyacyl-[acyl-carrier-protein] dehydratase
MAPSFFYDISQFDFSKPIAGPAEIEKINPQRGDMRHLDGIVWMAPDLTGTVGFKDVRENEFWVPGHIPGRPLLPGVIMIEAAAQLAAYIMKHRRPELDFIGFVGCDQVKFRGQVPPGKRLILIGKEVEFKPRRLICAAQGIVDGTLVFEAQITGMPI